MIKSNGTNNDQEFPLDLSQAGKQDDVHQEDDVLQQTGEVSTQGAVSSPIPLMYTQETNEMGEEIIYIQNMPIYEDDSDQPTAYININTPDHANENEDTEEDIQCTENTDENQDTEDTQHRDYMPQENDSEEELNEKEEEEEEQIMVSQKEINQALNNIKPGKKFPTWLYTNVKEENVDRIPEDINGMKKYKIQITDENDDWHKLTGDSRYFTMRSSSSKNLFGTRKIGLCQGSWVCPNHDCTFRKTSYNHQPNYINYTTLPGNRKIKICNICDNIMIREKCGARKMVEYDDGKQCATVYHLGTHKCHIRINNDRKREDMSVCVKKSNTTSLVTANQLGRDIVGKLAAAGKFEEAKQEARVWMDKKMAKKVINTNNPVFSIDENSFDAVAILKSETDKEDPYYIYRLNNGRMNGGSDYIFKSLCQMALLALKMDVNKQEETGLQEENAFFDATHTRVFGFKSFALWLVHSSMREMVHLASMEMRSESSEDIAIFFRLFNEMLEKVSGIPNYKFNPRCFLCDEAGANYKAIRLVYGDEFCQDRVRGCQFHFKQQIQKRKNDVPVEMRELFTDTCKQLCNVTTVAKYKVLKGRLEEMAQSVPTLHTWIQWWDDRRAHIFGP